MLPIELIPTGENNMERESEQAEDIGSNRKS